MAGSGTSSRTRVTRKGKSVKVTKGGASIAKRAKGPVKRTRCTTYQKPGGVAIPSNEPTEQGAPRIDQSTLNKSQSQLKKAKVAQSTASQPSTSGPSEPGASNADIPPGPVSNQTLSNQLAELINLVKTQNSRLERIEEALTAHGILSPQDDIAATAQGHVRGP